MNLLFLNSIEKETYGGMEEWIRLVAKGLSARGHCTLAAGRPGSEFLRRVGASGIDTIAVDISGDFNPITVIQLRRILVERNIDCVCVNFNKDVRLGGLAARLAGSVPVVWSVGLDIAAQSWVHRRLTPQLIDSVIVPSESLKRQITSHGYLSANVVTVIPIGIEDAPGARRSSEAGIALRSELHLPSNSIIAVTVGRFVTQKSHVTLVDAMPELGVRWPKLRFVFLGTGPLAESMQSRAQAAGVADKLIFGGMRDNVVPVLAGADLMIHPSLEEPFGIAVLEGMRAGLPIVASDVGGIPEVVGDSKGARLIEPRNPLAIATAVTDILSDHTVASKMGEANRRRFEQHFSVEGMVDRVERQFMVVCEDAPHHG
jgi:glycosyltransferase involved in cell wall biosynthesis